MMFVWSIFCFSVLFCIGAQASTHWMVTENGLIQPRAEAPFEMARPYDLLAFLNQDTRWDNINLLYHDLKKRKEIIKQLWIELERDTDVHSHLALDLNCLNAGSLSFFNWYAPVYDDGRTRIGKSDYFNIPEYKVTNKYVDVPDCKKISSLTFSMHAFEHLESMVHRQNLSIEPEKILPEKILPETVVTVSQFGHWLAGLLKKNSSSWLHYNMASFYWRLRGNAPKAMECSRRAVHYAPREYKDIALFNMGALLLRSKMVNDSVTVLGAAFDHDPNYLTNNFVLGNAYAVLGEYNNSINHYNICLVLDPTFALTEKHKFGVLCLQGLSERMLIIKDTIKRLRHELKEYSQREAHWLKSQASFLRTMDHNEKYDFTNVEKNCEKMSILTGLNIKELKKAGDKNYLIQYFLDGPMYSEKWLRQKGVSTLDAAYAIHRFVQHIQNHVGITSDYVARPELWMTLNNDARRNVLPPEILDVPAPKQPNEVKESHNQKPEKAKENNDSSEFETGVPLYENIAVGRMTQDFDVQPNWPSEKFCKESASTSYIDTEKVHPVFMPFENKGLHIESVLSTKIGVSLLMEHELPWHPPLCATEKDPTATSFPIKKSQKTQMTVDAESKEILRDKLLEYVGNGDLEAVAHMQDAEIGQRIKSAMQKKVAPKWLLYTLASLYWRVRGNNGNAMQCLLIASKTVPVRHRDIVLTSMASVYLEIGYLEEAHATAEEAFHLCLYEPATNLLLAQMNMVKHHRNTQLYHLKQVVRVEPAFLRGRARRLLYAWACIIKSERERSEFRTGEVCTQMEDGMSVVCGPDGSNCRLSNLHCVDNKYKLEGSSFLKMLKECDQGPKTIDENALEALVDDVVINVDRLGQRYNYQRLRRGMDNIVKDCGPHGCYTSMRSEDLSLKAEDCQYQHLQLGYWMHLLSFRQIFNDADIRVPPEVITMSASTKKIPECKLLSGGPIEEYIVQRLGEVNTDDWEPILNLMQQVAEMFNYFDYVTLGSKLAKYIDAHPRDWIGLMSAAWWCGAGGHAECCVRCVLAAYLHAPPPRARLPLLSATALLHTQSKLQDAKEIAYMMFYLAPKNQLEAFVLATAHTYVGEYDHAIWLYRYTMRMDPQYIPARACFHATLCLMFYGDITKK